jgi:hypothetical protein
MWSPMMEADAGAAVSDSEGVQQVGATPGMVEIDPFSSG